MHKHDNLDMVTYMETAKETENIQKVCRVMNENKIGSTVILKDSNFGNTEDKRPIGIITARDVLRVIAGDVDYKRNKFL